MISSPVTLLLTNSLDHLADLIVGWLGPDRVFRYNSDLWQDYALRVSDQVFELRNPAGMQITDAHIAKVYYRSIHSASELHPDRVFSPEEQYLQKEVSAAWFDILNIFWSCRKLVLVHPSASWRLGKMHQLRIAHKHFPITPYSFLINRPDALRDVDSVAKSFGFKYGRDSSFYSTRVHENSLDPNCPWFLTDLVPASWDVTVAVVRDECFAFQFDRSRLPDSSVDWRLANDASKNWTPLKLPQDIHDKIFSFMEEAGAHYARLDFLREDDRYVFLEANFTGEWGWLDLDGKHGLRAKVLHEIDPRTPIVPCPRLKPSVP